MDRQLRQGEMQVHFGTFTGSFDLYCGLIKICKAFGLFFVWKAHNIYIYINTCNIFFIRVPGFVFLLNWF